MSAAMITEATRRQISGHLAHLYDSEAVPAISRRIVERLEKYLHDSAASPGSVQRTRLSERTAVLITYADQITEPGVAPLQTLVDTACRLLQGQITDIHVLPFFPYSSDDGFSVIDYEVVDPALGTWDDIHCLTKQFGLMLDLVINHVSSESRWFQGFLRDEPEYREFFITVEGDQDLSEVVRPRALPLLTEVETAAGRKKVWTTFSADQIDLNYANPEVLLRVLDVLLAYVDHGARWVRLDAVAFLWKEIGKTSIHCQQTHHIVKLLRAVLDAVAPGVLLITETNVPHAENVQYFGNGSDEAQLVYQFPLPPLVVDAFQRGSATSLSDWAQALEPPPGDAMFYNFLASHDGIGLRPVEGLIPRQRIETMVKRTLLHGGQVSRKIEPDGRKSPYELNISFIDALSDPNGVEPVSVQVRKFLTAQAIMLGLAGIPGIYVHSLFGSRNWSAGVEKIGENRAINRMKFDKHSLLSELEDPMSLRRMIFDGMMKLLEARASTPAFRPRAPQRVISVDDRVFGILRDGSSPDWVLCLYNLSMDAVRISLDRANLGFAPPSRLVNLLGSKLGQVQPAKTPLGLRSYDTMWLSEATA